MEHKEIIANLTSDGAIDRCQGLIAAVRTHSATPDIIKAISALKDDAVLILGRKVSSYAIAALEALGAEHYQGNDVEILELIPFFQKGCTYA